MKKFMYFAAALLVLVGCNKNSQTNKENAPQEIVTIKGGIVLPKTPNKIAPAEDWQSADTPFEMLWEEGDQIYIWNEGGGETFTLTEGVGTTIGTFSGTKLANMSEYYVANVGQTGVGEYSVEYIENNFSHPYISGMGNEDGFTITNFGAVLGLPLKGDVTLSKIEVETFEGKDQSLSTFTMSFEEGLELNNTTATMVYFPVDASEMITIETINFYVDEELIMSKTLSEAKENLPGCNKVTTFPELVIPTYVDLGLPSGVKWATCNVGATKPEEYGDYFAWGETATKSDYSWGSYKYMQNGQSGWQYITKYTYPDNQTSGIWYSDGTFIGDNKTVLELADDAAVANWKGAWRMPTKAEFEELANTENCEWVWQEDYNNTGVNGYLVKSKKEGYTDNSIFLPAAGYYSGSKLSYDGSYGYYWSSSLGEYGSDRAYRLFFFSDLVGQGGINRCYGQSVRPVYKIVYK